ncbi:MAG: hypothetical protein JO025_21740 [Verrucomicrobia bacterium]|nr:hypothetical protein [Verrucomicrobiota bacterium]
MQNRLLAVALFACALTLIPASAYANYGDFSGGVAIGSSYAGTNTAPTNGLIVQGNVAIGTTTAPDALDVYGGMGFTTSTATVPTNGIYSPSANQLNFTTSGSTAFVITSSGSVGIGTTSPNYVLDVIDNVNANQTIAIENASSGGSVYAGFQASNGTSTLSYVMLGTGFSGAGVSQPGTALISASNTMAIQSTGIIQFAAGGISEQMRLTSTGSLGIGTTTPAQALEVNGEVKVDTFASGSATSVCQNGNVLSSCSSSIRYKEKVKPASFGLNEIMEMRPRRSISALRLVQVARRSSADMVGPYW